MKCGTYFFVVYKVNKKSYECGPYASLKEATSILVDHIPFLASIQSEKLKYEFKAEVQERLLEEGSGKWLTISTPLLENRCRKQKKKPSTEGYTKKNTAAKIHIS